jgi:hypothetical protein
MNSKGTPGLQNSAVLIDRYMSGRSKSNSNRSASWVLE